MNFKKKNLEDDSEKIRDKRFIRNKEDTKLEQRKRDSSKFEESSPKNEKINQTNKHSPQGNRKMKKDSQSRSPEKGYEEKRVLLVDKGDAKRKTQIQTMNVKIQAKKTVLEQESSPKYNPVNRGKKYTSMDSEISEEDVKPSKNVNLPPITIDESLVKKKSQKKSKSSHYIPHKRDHGKDNQKESVEYEESYIQESLEYQEHDSMEDQRDYEEDRHIEKRIKNVEKRPNPMFKPGEETQGKLITSNVLSYKAYDSKSPQTAQSAMQKMNKLSTILMSKSQEPEGRNDHFISPDKKVDTKLLKGLAGKKTSSKGKFISITMAMISSKGTNILIIRCELRR